MYYEDFAVGREVQTGSARFTRDSILAYAALYDPRVLAAERGGRGLVASSLHVASEGMRRLVDWHAAFRAAAEASGEPQPSLGVSPGFRDLRMHAPVLPDDVVTYSMRTVSARETSKPRWGLIGNAFEARNQRGEPVLSFSSLVLALRRSAEAGGGPRRLVFPRRTGYARGRGPTS